MLRTILLASLAAGFVAGLALTAIQALGVTPLILAAETYETDGAPGLRPHSHGALTHTHAFGAETHGHDAHAVVLANGDRIVIEPDPAAHSHGAGDDAAHHGDAGAWAPADGIERLAWTAIANVATAVGFALLLAALFAWRGDATWRKGLVWGIAGFVVFFANPAIGLHPEVPGTFSAGLLDRQLWWLFAVLCSAAGVGLLVVAPKAAAKIAGAALLAVPHVVGAPHPEVAGGLAPQALADEFVLATAIANGAFWLVLGPVTAIAFRRLVEH